jgi:hypothetical protein
MKSKLADMILSIFHESRKVPQVVDLLSVARFISF